MPKLNKLMLLSVVLVVPLRIVAQDVFAPIPTSWKADLATRLDLLIETRRDQEWDRFADLLSVDAKRNRSKSQLVKDYGQFPGVLGTNRSLVAFSPKATKLHDRIKGEWFIYGCAELKGFAFPVDAFIVAKRENENWYFSDIDGLTPRDSAWRRCGYDEPAVKRSKVE